MRGKAPLRQPTFKGLIDHLSAKMVGDVPKIVSDVTKVVGDVTIVISKVPNVLSDVP